MSDEGDGGYTGESGDAGYSGYDPGPDPVCEEPAAAEPSAENPSGYSEEELRRLEEYDKPIEHDPWGQAIVSLPAAALSAAGEVVVEGATWGAAAVEEGVAWVASEVGMEAVEQATEGGEGESGYSGGEGGYGSGADGAEGAPGY